MKPMPKQRRSAPSLPKIFFQSLCNKNASSWLRASPIPYYNTMKITSKYFETDDGVKLHYEEATVVDDGGGGANDDQDDNAPRSSSSRKRRQRVLLLLCGWGQSTKLFLYQMKAFASSHTKVVALDTRGHGSSEKPEHGYRISRLVR